MPPPNTMRGICGGEALGQVPSESTFSRAFDPFSSDNRPQAIHEALIKTHYGEKIAGHISRDATAIHAREKATAKPQEKTGQSKKECWCGYKLHLDVIDGDRSRANRRRIRKPRAERREGRCVPENHDSLPSDGAKTVTPTASAIFLAEPLVVPGFKREPRGVLQVPQLININCRQSIGFVAGSAYDHK